MVLDPPLPNLPLVAPSLPSTLRDNTMTYPDPPLPLAQSTKFEVDETFSVDARNGNGAGTGRVELYPHPYPFSKTLPIPVPVPIGY